MSSDNKIDYKSTIFLPKTNFPMKGNLPDLEKRILAYWDEIDVYSLIKQKKTHKRFLFHYGPPFANNNFHLGHGLTITLKDIIARFYTAMDYEVPILQGHDCYGYPIECEVQKMIEKDNIKDYSVMRVRKLCRAYAEKWSAIHKEQTKMLGVLTNIKPKKTDEMLDEEFYSTMNREVEYETYKLFSKLLLAGKVYRGLKPILWSIREQSTLAEVDVVYKQKESTSVYMKLAILHTNIKELENAHIIFWTTTPWTIISNLAVAFNKDMEYVAIMLNGEKCYVAKDMEMELIKKWDVLHTVQESDIIVNGHIFEHLYVEHPLMENKKVPLLHSDHVISTDGTGFVHVAPEHGEEDFILGEKYNLGILNYVEKDGYYSSETPLLAGKHIFKNENDILELLLPKLVSKEIIEHSYPFSDRSNAPLIYLCMEQVFINVQNEKDKLLKAIKTVNWYPPKGENRITAFVKNRPDWCLSRQRVWGNPLVVFIHKETNDILKNEQVQQTILNEIKKNGTDHLFELDWEVFLPEEIRCHYRPLYNTFDGWFDSGATHTSVVKPRFHTTISDLYLEGSDQHRGWFQSSLVTSVADNGSAPYRNIVTHGFLVDEKGHKISKSKGNGMPLSQCLAEGVDIIRVWVATCDYYEDIRISPSIFKDKIEIYRKIRNIIRYLIGATSNMTEEEISHTLTTRDRLEMYVLHKAYLIQQSIETYMHNFRVKDTFDEIFKFIQDLSSFYLDIKKDILYCDPINSNRRKSTRKTQYILLEFLLRVLGPIIPFTIEEAALELNRSTYNIKNIYLFETSLGNESIYNYINNLRTNLIPVKVALEQARINKYIDTHQEAVVHMPIINKEHKHEEIQLIEEILMVSKVCDSDNIYITKTTSSKCDRCWKYVGNLCDRCKDVDLTLFHV